MKSKTILVALSALALASCGGGVAPTSSAGTTSEAATSEATTSSEEKTTIEASSEEEEESSEEIVSGDVNTRALLSNIANCENPTIANYTAMIIGGLESKGVKEAKMVMSSSYYREDGYLRLEKAMEQVSIYDLDAFLKTYGLTLEQFKASQSTYESMGFKVSIDEDNNTLTMSMDGENEVTYCGYDEEAKQWVGSNYSLIEEEETLTKSQYLFDSEVTTPILMLDNMDTVLTGIIAAATYDKENSAFVLTGEEIDKAIEALNIPQKGMFEKLTLYVEDDYPTMIDFTISEKALANTTSDLGKISGIEMGFLLDYTDTLDYGDLSEKMEEVTCFLDCHGYTGYDYGASSYRKYCKLCHKYIGEWAEYDFDETYHVDPICQYQEIDEEETSVEGTLIGADENFKYYALSYKERFDLAWDGQPVRTERLEGASTEAEGAESMMCSAGESTYIYYPDFKALLIRENLDPVRLSEDSCTIIDREKVGYYPNFKIDQEAGSNEFFTVNGESIYNYLDEHPVTPEKEVVFNSVSSSHGGEGLGTIYPTLSPCIYVNVSTCSACGEVAYVEEVANHTFDSARLLTSDEFALFLESADLSMYSSFFGGEGNAYEVTCSVCGEVEYWILPSDYWESESGYRYYYKLHLDHIYGGYSLNFCFDELPHIYGDDGKCIFCGQEEGE